MGTYDNKSPAQLIGFGSSDNGSIIFNFPIPKRNEFVFIIFTFTSSCREETTEISKSNKVSKTKIIRNRNHKLYLNHLYKFPINLSGFSPRDVIGRVGNKSQPRHAHTHLSVKVSTMMWFWVIKSAIGVKLSRSIDLGEKTEDFDWQSDGRDCDRTSSFEDWISCIHSLLILAELF